MNVGELKYKFGKNDPLNELDNESKTFGCRCYNPDICKYYTSSTCGLTNESHICTTPSRKWKKLFEELKSQKNK